MGKILLLVLGITSSFEIPEAKAGNNEILGVYDSRDIRVVETDEGAGIYNGDQLLVAQFAFKGIFDTESDRKGKVADLKFKVLDAQRKGLPIEVSRQSGGKFLWLSEKPKGTALYDKKLPLIMKTGKLSFLGTNVVLRSRLDIQKADDELVKVNHETARTYEETTRKYKEIIRTYKEIIRIDTELAEKLRALDAASKKTSTGTTPPTENDTELARRLNATGAPSKHLDENAAKPDPQGH